MDAGLVFAKIITLVVASSSVASPDVSCGRQLSVSTDSQCTDGGRGLGQLRFAECGGDNLAVGRW